MARTKGRRRKRRGGRVLHPGVYVEEVSSGTRPIEGVGTSTAAFIGSLRRHPWWTAALLAALAAVGARAAVTSTRRAASVFG